MKKSLLTLVLLVPTLASAVLVPIDWGGYTQVQIRVEGPGGRYAAYDPIAVEFTNFGGFDIDLLPDGFISITTLEEISDQRLIEIVDLGQGPRFANGTNTPGSLFPGLLLDNFLGADIVRLLTVPIVDSGTRWDIQIVNDVPEPTTVALCAAGLGLLALRRVRV